MCLSHILFCAADESRAKGLDEAAAFDELLQSTIQIVLQAAEQSSLSMVSNDLVDATLRRAADPFLSVDARWVYLALFRLHALLPEGGIDPSLRLRVELHTKVARLDECLKELEMRAEKDRVSGLACGPIEHESLNFVSQRAAALRKEIALLEKRVIFRPESQDFARFYSEVKEFSDTLGSTALTTNLVESIISKDRSCITEEQLWQDSSAQLCETLKSGFTGYPDLVEPLLVSICQMKSALRRLAFSAFTGETQEKAARLSSVRQLLGAFPMSAVAVGEREPTTQLEALNSIVSVREELSPRAWTLALRAVFERALTFLKLSSRAQSTGTESNWNMLDEIMSAFADQYAR
jgi:hypothetical protein